MRTLVWKGERTMKAAQKTAGNRQDAFGQRIPGFADKDAIMHRADREVSRVGDHGLRVARSAPPLPARRGGQNAAGQQRFARTRICWYKRAARPKPSSECSW